MTGRDEEVVSPILECVDQLSGGRYRAHFGYLNQGQRGRAACPSACATPSRRRQRTAASRARSSPAERPTSSRSTSRDARVDARRPHVDRERELEALRSVLRVASHRQDPPPGRRSRDASTSRSTASPPAPAAASATSARPATSRRPPAVHRVGEEGVRRHVAGRLRHVDRVPRRIAAAAPSGRPSAARSSSSTSAPDEEVVCTIVNTRRTGPPVPPTPSPGPTPPGHATRPDPAHATRPQPPSARRRRRRRRSPAPPTSPCGSSPTGVTAARRHRHVDPGDHQQRPADGDGRHDPRPGGRPSDLRLAAGLTGHLREEDLLRWGRSRRVARVRIVARTRMLTVGARLNTVSVRGEQPDSNPENNAASALVRIRSAFTPPLTRALRRPVRRPPGGAGRRLDASACACPQRLRPPPRWDDGAGARGRPADLCQHERARRRDAAPVTAQGGHRALHGRRRAPHRRRRQALHRPARRRAQGRHGARRDRLPAREGCRAASRRAPAAAGG